MVLRDKYEVGERLGAGGMGTVYRARHLVFGETRALKLLARHVAQDGGYLARFRAEAALARRLDHPGAVKVEAHAEDAAGNVEKNRHVLTR